MPENKSHPTACGLCYANCGIRVETQDGHITKVRGDREHPASRGYLCQKASRLDYYQNGKDRLTSPLRRRPDGTFEAIDWDTAIREVAARLMAVKERFGGDKILYYGGGGQGNHLGPLHFTSTQRALDIRVRSNALAQEKTGLAWTSERVFGGYWHGDFEHCDVAVMMGKNAWQTNGFQRARVILQEISSDPARSLIVMDPRRTETAELADVHLAVRPGTDAWCLTAILGWMAQHDQLNGAWLEQHANGHQPVIEVLKQIPVAEYAAFAGIELAQISTVANLLASTDRIAVYEDVGVEMAPNSTLVSYLNALLFTLRGSFANPGGMHLVNPLASIFSFGSGSGAVNAEGIEENYRRSTVTGARIVCGLLPCNSITEEILADHPARIRAMIVESGNPAHSTADSQRFREACATLDTVVVIDVAMTETAQLAHYVLPASSQFEKVEATFFNFEYPDNFFHLRHPVFPPMAGTLEEAEIHARLIEAFGIFQEGELDELRERAKAGLTAFAAAYFSALQRDPRFMAYGSYVLYRTLGQALPAGMASAAFLWMLCQNHARTHPADVRRAGHAGEGFELGNALFSAMLTAKSGLIVSRAEPGDDPNQWRKPSGKVELGMGEMLNELQRLRCFDLPARSTDFPFLLVAGERRSYTANTAIRNPEWMKSNFATALIIHPEDAKHVGLRDGGIARVVTRRASAEVTIHCDDCMHRGTISLPNGLGLSYPDASGRVVVTGVSPNEFTAIEDRDPFVGTPWHKHVRARLEAVS